MQDMKGYYDIQARLHYYGLLPTSTSVSGGWVIGKLGTEPVDPRHWKEPPHVYLANMLRNEQDFCAPVSVEMFVRKYGVLFGDLSYLTLEFRQDCIDFTAFQETLRKAWKNDAEALEEVKAQLEILDLRKTLMDSGLFLLVTENLWTFICFFFMRDLSARKAKVCKSLDCPNPFFIEQRKGQMYCSHVCAVRENVRRFRRTQVQKKQRRITTKNH